MTACENQLTAVARPRRPVTHKVGQTSWSPNWQGQYPSPVIVVHEKPFEDDELAVIRRNVGRSYADERSRYHRCVASGSRPLHEELIRDLFFGDVQTRTVSEDLIFGDPVVSKLRRIQDPRRRNRPECSRNHSCGGQH